MLVSMKCSALIHHIARQLRAEFHLAAQSFHGRFISLHAFLCLGVLGQPEPELFIQGRVFGACPRPGRFDQCFFSREGDILRAALQVRC